VLAIATTGSASSERASHGVRYEACEQTKSDLYQALLPVLNEAHRSAGHPAAFLAIVLAGTQDGGGVTYPAIVAGQNIKKQTAKVANRQN
jgi:hypothetical protein